MQKAEPSNLAGFRKRAAAPPELEYSPTSPMDDLGEGSKTPGESENAFRMPPEIFKVPEGLPTFRKQAGAPTEFVEEEKPLRPIQKKKAKSNGGGEARKIRQSLSEDL